MIFVQRFGAERALGHMVWCHGIAVENPAQIREAAAGRHVGKKSRVRKLSQQLHLNATLSSNTVQHCSTNTTQHSSKRLNSQMNAVGYCKYCSGMPCSTKMCKETEVFCSPLQYYIARSKKTEAVEAAAAAAAAAAVAAAAAAATTTITTAR